MSPSGCQKAPEISRTSAPWQEEDHEKYSVEGGLGVHQNFLVGDLRRRGSLYAEGLKILSRKVELHLFVFPDRQDEIDPE